MNTSIKPILTAVAFVGVLGSGIVLADKDDTRHLVDTKITLTEAITIAEKHQNGRAYEAGLDDDSFSPEYEVNVLAGDKIYEITVNGVTGEVDKVREDK